MVKVSVELGERRAGGNTWRKHGAEEEGGRSLRGACLCVCLEWLVRNADSDPQGCGVHREVEEAFTIQLIHHLSRDAFLSTPTPTPNSSGSLITGSYLLVGPCTFL